MIGNGSNSNLKINDAGLEIIKFYESLRLRPYRDTGGVWTIGWGHTKTAEQYLGKSITREKADELLRQDVLVAEQDVLKHTYVPLTENQFSALVSFVFNLGGPAYAKSTLRKLLNAGQYKDAAGQFQRWVYDNGVKLNGLVKRRETEKQLFLKGTL